MKKFYVFFMILACLAFSQKAISQISCKASFYLDSTASTLFNAVLVNNSTATGIVPPDSQVFMWYWGDGTSTWGIKFPTHTYTSPGSRSIVLYMTNNFNSCHDSMIKMIRIDSNGSFHKTNGAYNIKVVAPSGPSGIRTAASQQEFVQLVSGVITGHADFRFNEGVGSKTVQVDMYSIEGKLVLSGSYHISGMDLSIPTSSLPAGMYMAYINIEGKSAMMKMIKP